MFVDHDEDAVYVLEFLMRILQFKLEELYIKKAFRVVISIVCKKALVPRFKSQKYASA